MIDDESKKFIKETIENAVENKLSEHEKKTESSKRLNELKYEKKEIEDRKKLIAELSERERKGQATIAERFEKLKLSVDTAIPKDFKDAWKTGTQGIQAGANQVGRGVGHLTARAMMSNPLTAFLYQNRDIAGAVGDIGVGTIKAGWGALKGIGHGALGIANSVKNLFGKNEEEETEEELNLPKPKFLGGESQTEKLVSEKSDWQKQIHEMHKIMTKDLIKEQKSSNTVLSKGLKGLDEGMKAVKGFTDMIAAKQKLILGGIMLGAAAIIGLVVWFKSGGWKNLLKNPMETPINDSFANRDANQTEAFDLDAKGTALSSLTGTDQQKLFNKKPEMLTGIANTNKTTTKALDGNGQSIDLTKMDFTTGSLTPVLAPYDGVVSKLNKQTNMSQGKAVNVRWVMVIAPVDTTKYPVLKLSNLTSPQFQPNNNFKKGDILAYSTSAFSMENYYGYENDKMNSLNDYQSDVNKAKSLNYKDNLQRLADVKDAKQTEKLKDFQFKKERASYYNQDHEGDKMAEFAERTHDFFHNKNEDIERNRYEASQAEATNEFLKRYNGVGKEGTATGFAADVKPSVNITKAKEQNEQLSKKPEKQQTQTQEVPQGQGYMGQLPSLTVKQTDKTDPYRSADNVTIGELNLMNPNTPVNIAMVNN